MFRDVSTMTEVMYTYIILHNMILEHEGSVICVYNENEVIPKTQPLQYGGQERILRMKIVNNAVIHADLRTI